MRILAIDTSTRGRVCAAGVEDDGVTAGWRGRVVRDGRIDVVLAPLVAEIGLDGLDAVVVVTGPGSRAGIRAGLAAGLGIAAAHRLPVHPLGALEVVASAALAGVRHAPGEGAVVALADAGRGGLHVAEYVHVQGGVRESVPPARVEAAGWRPPPGAVAVTLEAFAGCPPGVGVLGSEAGIVAGLATAALGALERPALDLDALAGLEG